jgi:DNA-binding MarR family transcriptional regulator
MYDWQVHPLTMFPETVFEAADRIRLKSPTEAGLAELPPSELEVLRLVTLFPGCGIAFLTSRTKMRQANVSVTVRSLVERGLVTKVADERDRRAVRLRASEQADKDLDALRKVWLQRVVHASAEAGVSEDEVRRAFQTLTKLLPHLPNQG